MEKYRRFADSFTGINPFLPVFLNKKKKINETLLKVVMTFRHLSIIQNNQIRFYMIIDIIIKW